MSQTKMLSRLAPIETSRFSGARARAHDLDRAKRLARKLERVGHGRGDDNRGAVLVIVEDGNAHAGLRLLLDLETFRALDVFEIDAAECRLERDDDVDELVDVGLLDLDIEHVDAGEFLEEDGLALHDRLRRERADGPEAQDGGAVGQDRNEVLARRIKRRRARVGGDRLAGKGEDRKSTR